MSDVDFVLSRIDENVLLQLNCISGSEQAEIAAKFLSIARDVSTQLGLPLWYVSLRLASTNQQLETLLYH
jgi:hypothetical protein